MIYKMMAAMVFENPAVLAFARQIRDEFVLAEVHIARRGPGFELRHLADRTLDASRLREVPPAGMRSLAQQNAHGQFRPLKSAPTLVRGWRCCVRDEPELGDAVDRVYPGAIADWHAVRSGHPAVTDFETFTGRQSGMYRITFKLSAPAKARVIGTCCGPVFCLKHRLWPAAGTRPDAPESKSAIPCLEPCAVLLEFARVMTRVEQEEKVLVPLAASEIQTLRDALRLASEIARPNLREGDVAAADHPKRMKALLAKLEPLGPAAT